MMDLGRLSNIDHRQLSHDRQGSFANRKHRLWRFYPIIIVMMSSSDNWRKSS